MRQSDCWTTGLLNHVTLTNEILQQPPKKRADHHLTHLIFQQSALWVSRPQLNIDLTRKWFTMNHNSPSFTILILPIPIDQANSGGPRVSDGGAPSWMTPQILAAGCKGPWTCRSEIGLQQSIFTPSGLRNTFFYIKTLKGTDQSVKSKEKYETLVLLFVSPYLDQQKEKGQNFCTS